ncbi:glycosyltransferase [Deltaproteobacteria bacterium]|nr:glycosyltransferase [Deltaproteobacteria bacterium]
MKSPLRTLNGMASMNEIMSGIGRYPKKKGASQVIINISGVARNDLIPLDALLMEQIEIRGLPIDISSTQNDALNIFNEWEDKHSLQKIRDLYSNGSWLYAIEACNNRMMVYKDEVAVSIILVRSLYSSSKYLQCIDSCQMILNKHPNHVDALRFIARSQKNLGNDSEAAKIYKDLALMDNEDTDSRIMLLRHHYGHDNLDQVIKYCDELQMINPDIRESLLFKVRALHKKNEWEKSLKPAKKLIEINSNDVEGRVECGRTFYMLGRIKEARIHLEKALELNPNEARARRTLARVYEKTQQWDEALEIYRIECHSHPMEYSNWEERIKIFYRMNDEESARNVLNDVRSLITDEMECHMMCYAISNSFYWDDEISQLEIQAKDLWSNNNQYNEKVANFNLDRGNLAKSLHYIKELKKSGTSQIHAELEEKLESILIKNNTPLSFVEHHLERGIPLLQTECAIQAIVKRCREVKKRRFSKGKPSVAMISSSLGRGGAERQVVTCLKGLKGHIKLKSIALYCYRLDNTGGRLDTYSTEVEALGIPIHQFGNSADWNKKYSNVLDSLNQWRPMLNQLPLSMRRVVEPLFLAFKANSPTIVHAWQDSTNINVSLAAMMAGVPRIFLFARSQRPDGKTMMHIRNSPYLKKSYDVILEDKRATLATNSLAGSKSYAEWLGRDINEFPVIHNGVDFKTIAESSEGVNLSKTLREFGITSKDKVVGSVFRFVQEKQPLLWVETMAKVIDSRDGVHGVIVGDGGLFGMVRELIHEKGLQDRIHLVGQTREVKAWLDRFDLFLLTSSIEGLPNVLIEAQAFGVPVVSTDAGGSADTFLDGISGRLCKTSDPELIAAKVIKCIDNKKWLKSASSESIKNGRKAFSTDTMIKRLVELYES